MAFTTEGEDASVFMTKPSTQIARTMKKGKVGVISIVQIGAFSVQGNKTNGKTDLLHNTLSTSM